MHEIIVIGRGEVGEPLSAMIAAHYPTTTYDILDGELPPFETAPQIMHICIPYTPLFEKAVIDYINQIKPKLVIIESTVPPGTTRNIYNKTKVPICYSPVLGQGDDFIRCLLAYEKFIGPIDKESGIQAAEHFHILGMKTHICKTPEDMEWAKLLETSYWGLLVTWFQEIERISETFNLNQNEIIHFFATVQKGGIWPRPILWVGPLGGHSIVPNARLLLQKYDSNFVADILRSHLAFEATMQSVQNQGEKDDCPLCGRVFTRKIYRNETSEPFFIIQCLTCREPMVVFRNHLPTEKQVAEAKKTAAPLFSGFKIDLENRSIPTHGHFHLRKEEKA